jgi:hypothetical protein
VAAVEARVMFDDKERVAPAAKECSGGPHIVFNLGRRVLSIEGLGSSWGGQGKRAGRAAMAGRRLRPGAGAPGRAGRGASEPPRAQRAPRRHGVVRCRTSPRLPCPPPGPMARTAEPRARHDPGAPFEKTASSLHAVMPGC